MKEFSDYEKRILRELLKVEETPGGLTVLGNIIDFELFPNFYIELNSETDCPVRIAKSYLEQIASTYGPLGINEVIKQLNTKLFSIVKLFQYLERENQVHFYGDVPLKTLGSTFDVSETPVKYELEDKETISLIYHFSRKRIIPEDSLKTYVKKDFITVSESKIVRQQEATSKKLNWTAAGVIVTIIGLIISNFIEIKKMNHKDPSKIYISNDTLNFRMKLDSIDFGVKIRKFEDTLTVQPKPTKKTLNTQSVRKEPQPLKVEIVKFNDSLTIKK